MQPNEKVLQIVDLFQKSFLAGLVMNAKIETDEMVIIPLCRISLGCVNLSGKNLTNIQICNSNAAGGWNISPLAVLTIHKTIPGPEGVKIIPLWKNVDAIDLDKEKSR